MTKCIGRVRTIYKYPLSFISTGSPISIGVPAGATPIYVDFQDDLLHVWMEVDNDALERSMSFCIFGTGFRIDSGWSHLYSWQDGPFVWHLYYRVGETDENWNNTRRIR